MVRGKEDKEVSFLVPRFVQLLPKIIENIHWPHRFASSPTLQQIKTFSVNNYWEQLLTHQQTSTPIMSVCVCVCVYVCMSVCGCGCMCVCVYLCMCVCV